MFSFRTLNVVAVALALSASTALIAIATPFGQPGQASAATCTSSVGPGIPPPPTVPSGVPGFHAAWFGQSGYPTLCAGEKSTATVAYYNSGSRGWVSGRMGEMAFLGTWNPIPGQDMASFLGGDGTNGSPATGWPRYNRVAAQPADYVGPNQVSWFQFTIQAPTTPGTYLLYIRPLVEGAQWMEDFGVFWQVTVKAAEPPPVGVTVTPTDTASVTIGDKRSYTVTINGLTGCLDLAFVDASTFVADGTFRDADGDGRADFTTAATFASVNGVAVNSSYVDCVTIPSGGTFTFSATSSTANSFVRPVVFQDTNSNNALDLDSAKHPTETSAVGGPVRFIPQSGTFGSHTVTVGLVNVAEKYFTDSAATATYRYDANDTFQLGGIGVSMSQFEQLLSSGDTVAVSYNPDAAAMSTFNITSDVGRQAPSVTTAVDSFDGGATQNDVRLTITEPTSNVDGIIYSVQRTATAPAATCDASSGTYAEIATVTTPAGSDTATYTDNNLANGTYCYRVGTTNPVTSTTTFGYSAATTVTGASATVNPPTSADARVTTAAGFTTTFDSGDVIKIAFSKAIVAPTSGATVRAQDADGTIGDLICGTNATCTLNASAETLGGVSYPTGSVLTITMTGSPSIATAGSTAGLQVPATVTDSSGIRDSGNNAWNLASSTDVVLGSPD